MSRWDDTKYLIDVLQANFGIGEVAGVKIFSNSVLWGKIKRAPEGFWIASSGALYDTRIELSFRIFSSALPLLRDPADQSPEGEGSPALELAEPQMCLEQGCGHLRNPLREDQRGQDP